MLFPPRILQEYSVIYIIEGLLSNISNIIINSNYHLNFIALNLLELRGYRG